MNMKRKCLLLLEDMVEYGKAWEYQKSLFELRESGKIADSFLLLQHPPTFTYGRRYKDSNLTANKETYEQKGFAVYKSDRGGLATYHGPGQIVGYPILKMCSYTKDFHQYLRMLEEVMLRTLRDFGISSERKIGHTGVWVNQEKIGFIGVRVGSGYTMHGFSLNVNNDLSPFLQIIPCGIEGIKITSVHVLLHKKVGIEKVYIRLASHFSCVFEVEMVSAKMQELLNGIDAHEECVMR
ncbi:MAG: lipoyl(octanoyl) transferase LipB [Candidatus Brocadiaceae bacterium]|nr:lipoyl(octanoyl) transferase LipB [Candidatus Brocadiaceae bacterium]